MATWMGHPGYNSLLNSNDYPDYRVFYCKGIGYLIFGHSPFYSKLSYYLKRSQKRAFNIKKRKEERSIHLSKFDYSQFTEVKEERGY